MITLPQVIQCTILLNALLITPCPCYHPLAGSDYNILVNSVTIPKNSLIACFPVEIVNDNADEDDMERFIVELIYSGAENVSLGPPSSFEVIILGQSF